MNSIVPDQLPTQTIETPVVPSTSEGQSSAAGKRASGSRVLQLTGLLLAYTALTVLFTWPIAAHLSDHLRSSGDPLDSVWRVAWGQERLLRAPWRLFDGNTFYPYPRSYLFDELLFGSAVLSLPLRLVTANPIAIYNLTLLATFVLSALAMYALARRLRCHQAAAFAAGLIYAFAPLHMAHLDHLSLMSGQYLPVVILLLDRLFAAPRWRDALALALVLAMQALSSQYYAYYLAFAVAGFLLLRVAQLSWHRQFPGRAVWSRLIVAGGLAALAVLPFAIGYGTVRSDYQFQRSMEHNIFFAANVTSFFTADSRNWLWGQLTAPLRALGPYTFERIMFPGLLALLLGLAGAIVSWRRWLAQYFILLGAGSALLALGPGLYLTGDPQSLRFAPLPYRYLYDHLPGFDAMRVPARIGVLYGLSVAALAGLGLTWLLERVARWRRPRALPGTAARGAGAAVLAGLVIGGICLESANRPATLEPIATGDRVPQVYRWLATQPVVALIELPFVIPKHDRVSNSYQYYSLYHRHETVNGSADIVPAGYKSLAEELYRGPTPRALAILQGLGVTHVVVHYDLLGTQLGATTRETLDSLPDQVRAVASFGDAVVYRLAETDRFARLRAMVPREASIYLAQEGPWETYIGMLGWILRDNALYARVPTGFGQDRVMPPQPGARYDYAVLHRRDDPAAVGFADADLIWEDDVARVYRRKGPTAEAPPR